MTRLQDDIVFWGNYLKPPGRTCYYF